MRFLFIIFILTLFFTHTAFADISSQAGRAAAPFLKISLGARPTGLGESFVAISDDVDAINWNPAGLAYLKYPQLSTSHIEFFQDINFEAINYAHPVKNIGVTGIGFILMYMPPITKTILTQNKSDVIEVGTFIVRDMALSLSLARSLTDNLSMGTSLKLVQQRIDVATNNGILFDVGLLYKNKSRRFSIGANLQNFGEFEIDRAPITLRLGTAYYIIPYKLLIAAGSNIFFDNNPVYSVGIEYNVATALTLRAGYNYKYKSKSDRLILNEFTAGAGFRYENFYLDYAYVPYGVLGDSHRLSAKFAFGKPVTPKLIIKDIFTPQFESKKRIGDSYKDIDWEAGKIGVLRGLPPEGNKLTFVFLPQKKIIEPEQTIISPEIEPLKPLKNEKLQSIQKNLQDLLEDELSIEMNKQANFCFLNGNYYEAIDLYLKILKKYPSTYIIKYNIAGIYYSLGLFDEAIKWYKDAINDNPFDPDSFFWLGFSYYKIKDIENAKIIWRKTIEIDPENIICKLNLKALENTNN
ncbi:MAG: PorV/PorQ family protein [Candidatus Hydrogenedentota bacterium]